MVGAGAIGGVTAAFITLGGGQITLLCHRESQARALRESGLHLRGRRGEQRVKLDAVSSLSGSYDLCFIATKAGALADALRQVLPHLTEDALVVCLQNGMCRDILEEAVGPQRAAAAVVSWSCTLLSDEEMDFTGEGGFVLGRFSGARDRQLEEAAALLNLMAPTRITDKIGSEIFSKLIINSAITCGGAMSGQTVGQMLFRAPARRFFIALVGEDMALAKALGLTVPPFGGRLDYEKFLRAGALYRHLLLFAVGLKYRRLSSSSLTSLRRGQATEMPYLNGWISRQAGALGLKTPVNDAVVRIIKEIEGGQRKICPENILETLK